MPDFPSSSVCLPWKDDSFSTGRIQVVHHSVAGHAVISANVYGYPSGPTYPDAHKRTNALLSTLTEKLVLGRTGLRCIVGDYNANPSQLDEVSIWRQRRCIEAQELAWNRWVMQPQPTCKGRTTRDFIFLSPELAALCTNVMVQDHFQEQHCLCGLQVSFLLDPLFELAPSR